VLIGELIGVFLVGYGIWFASEGIKRYFGGAKDWWRPIRGKRRYPYPFAGALLGVCFVLMGLVFALHNRWTNTRTLVWVGGGVFLLVLAFGIGQPRFLHPRWYGELEDRFGKKGMLRLRREAFTLDDEEWQQVNETDATFKAWVERTMPRSVGARRRGGYTKPE